MKKLIIITFLIVTVCIITSFAVLPTIKSSSEGKADINNSYNSSNLTYIVKNFNGNIAVFQPDKDTPFRITDVPISSLSYTDQEIIKSGIIVNSKTELNKILEDYCS